MDRCKECGRAFKKDRSNNQNRYYWGIVIALLSEHTGFSPEEMHEILKHKFLRYTVWIQKKDNIKEQSVIARSTTSLSTKQFEEFMSQIRQWAGQDLGVSIPEPNEVLQD